MNKNQRRWWNDKEFPDLWAIWFGVTFCLTCALIFIAGLAVGIQGITNHAARVDCKKFATNSGYQTEFAYYGYWNNECFAIVGNARIPIDKLFNNQGN